MPNYSYRCQDCQHEYEEFRSFSEGHPKKCPKCGAKYGKGFEQAWDRKNVDALVYGNPQTIGQLADENTRKMSKEEIQKKSSDLKQRQSKFTGKLPKGATINTTKPETPWWRPEGSKPLDARKLSSPEKVKKYVETGEGL